MKVPSDTAPHPGRSKTRQRPGVLQPSGAFERPVAHESTGGPAHSKSWHRPRARRAQNSRPHVPHARARECPGVRQPSGAFERPVTHESTGGPAHSKSWHRPRARRAQNSRPHVPHARARECPGVRQPSGAFERPVTHESTGGPAHSKSWRKPCARHAQSSRPHVPHARARQRYPLATRFLYHRTCQF